MHTKRAKLILLESWSRGLIIESLNLTNRFDQTNPTQIQALILGNSCIRSNQRQTHFVTVFKEI